MATRERLVLFARLGLVALSVAPRLVARGSVAWGWFAASAVATLVAGGPGAWIARERLFADRFEPLAFVLGAVALLAFPFVLTAMLPWEVGTWSTTADSAFLGAIAGIAAAFLAERGGVRDRVVARFT